MAGELRLSLRRAIPAQLPSAEIEQVVQIIKGKVPQCDAIILAFIEESVRCYKADARLACAFMLGAASEKAMGLLFVAFGDSIADAAHRANYVAKTNKKMITVRYEE